MANEKITFKLKDGNANDAIIHLLIGQKVELELINEMLNTIFFMLKAKDVDLQNFIKDFGKDREDKIEKFRLDNIARIMNDFGE